ncbi:MAG: hypothetical protein IJ433_01145 [Ruminococcus sp.]|nr:hypothetical protein [Ruminococcus sp.]
MKNTTFRKKALLSSVAMLLVALVALGSATFAWFTQNPTVSAEGLTLKATAAAGLQIVAADEGLIKFNADNDDVFGTSTTLKATAVDVSDPAGVELAEPVSLDVAKTDGIKFYTATAEKEYDEKMLAGTISDGTPSYSEKIYLRKSIDSESEVKIVNTKVTLTQSDKATDNDAAELFNLYNSIRVTIFDGNKHVGTWAPDGQGNLYVTNGALSSTAATFYGNGAVAPMEKTVKYVADADYDDADFVTLYVWLDGEDENCYTANVENLKNLVSSVEVLFSTKTLS